MKATIIDVPITSIREALERVSDCVKLKDCGIVIRYIAVVPLNCHTAIHFQLVFAFNNEFYVVAGCMVELHLTHVIEQYFPAWIHCFLTCK